MRRTVEEKRESLGGDITQTRACVRDRMRGGGGFSGGGR